ncbi:S1C family serine protease [Pseudonocardia asaccharolytica]|uniref:Serine protease n=1 Tax=Pseudonocardia asaccharolytica DSM 44247 = NBRC 16224 TaxID=1123024 RepID=A0A511D6K9_9PSEU|nr:trypsin-like peptidase domain-containing protein [Pseudonocardia asaccharolytica]GEL18588.1 serine protease [Pseudonocardia asaccharolytica DSM 44247 = NBRC 16224]
MNDQQDGTTSGPPAPDRPAPPRLGPRPLARPPVDAGEVSAFGRPAGVDGGFAQRPPRNGAAAPGSSPAGPPPAALASAFGRPDGDVAALQRPPRPGQDGPDRPPAFWDDPAAPAEEDPWRDPGSGAELGPPPVAGPVPAPPPSGPGARLSVREVLFGRRVHPRALALLAFVALLIGAAGGLVGRLTAEGASGLTTPDATIAQATNAKERPPGSVAAIAARVVPAVVSLEIRVGDQGGTGSGVVIDPAGYVLTNNHVVAPAAQVPGATVEAVFSDGSRAPAQIVGRDPKTDLAVVKVAVANPTVAQIGSSGALAVGDAVLAVGSPLGLAGTVTDGIVSAVDRPVRLDGGGNTGDAVIDAIQTDAAINPGNSGGPLVDSTGAVVGINTAIRSLGQGEGGSIGLGFAIPIDDARRIAEQLIRAGVVRHAELGVNAKSVTDGATDGAQVQNVVQGGAAAAAGIVEGDVIVRVGERAIAGADELVVAVRELEPGQNVSIQLIRDGRPLAVTAVLTAD